MRLANTHVSDSLGTVPGAEDLIIDGAVVAGVSDEVNTEGKTSLAAELRDDTSNDEVVIRPVVASLDGNDPSWWSLLYSNAQASAKGDGVQGRLDDAKSDVMPVAIRLGPDGTGPAATLRLQVAADGKSDSQEVVRDGKGSLPARVFRLSDASQ